MINLTDLPHDISLHRVLGPKETAAFLGLTVTQLGRMKDEGVLPKPLHYSPRRYGWSVGTLLTYLDFIEMRDSGSVFRRRTDRDYFHPNDMGEDILEHMEYEQNYQQMDYEMERSWKEQMKLGQKNTQLVRPMQ